MADRRRPRGGGRALGAALVTAVGVLLGVGCSPSKPADQGPPTTPAAARQVFVALGGVETLNSGRDDLPDDWTQLVFTEALSTSAVHVNLASADGTVQNALDVQLPDAAALHPTIATVWVGAADVRNGTGAITFRDELTQLVTRLREAGARRVVLLTQPSTMPSGGSAYTAAVGEVARESGATLVTIGYLPFPLTDAGQRAIAGPVIAALRRR